MIKCDICDKSTDTRLCDDCYECLKGSSYLFKSFNGDMQVSHAHYQPFPWAVKLTQINYSVHGTGQSLKEAFTNARKQLMV